MTVIASETLVGELNGSLTSRVKDIADTLDNAGIPSRASDNIMRDIWHKALYNIALNPLSAIFVVSYGEIADNLHTRRLIKQGTGVLVPTGVRHRTNSQEIAIFIVFRHKQTACMLA